jgi:hypothetical protein
MEYLINKDGLFCDESWNILNGKYILTTKTGYVYEGYFVNGKMHGEIIVSYNSVFEILYFDHGQIKINF